MTPLSTLLLFKNHMDKLLPEKPFQTLQNRAIVTNALLSRDNVNAFGKASGMDHGTVENCTVVRQISIPVITEEKSHPYFYQQKLQKPGSVMWAFSISTLGKRLFTISVMETLI